MRKVLSRSILVGIALTLVLTIILLSVFLISFPLDNWLDIWYYKVWQIPFIIFICLISLPFGIISGLIIGLFWKKQLEAVERALTKLEQVTPDTTITYEGPMDDVLYLMKKIQRIQVGIQDQTKRSQKLISERVENQQEKIEEVITQERNRLARELHDSVSQELFAASMLVSAMNEMPVAQENQIKKPIKQVETMIQQAQLEMRALLLHLRPIALKDNSLKQGMDQLLHELDQKIPLHMAWSVQEVDLSRGVEDHLFRILQESVSNTLRHAKAESVDILLVERDGFVILRIMDDGVGFNLEEKKSSSYGLVNMEERAAEIGAKLRIVSVLNKGTRIEVRVPIIDVEGDVND
ncbi:sensor histidine kinase [Paraliobacillus quinghaiensis]|uniref:Sensor histidine kinase n=1 Tax=Paraliobacillus quinghaiensis TaxID=470815 RepID=A0A917TR50_9BACI|nr:sensor histidine kinase [Paraliobacillus quinghaiensis]GGM33202.1 sensor histidine kinase [Paraliobacillus quinghaiensis]